MTFKLIGFPIVPGEKMIWRYQRGNQNP